MAWARQELEQAFLAVANRGNERRGDVGSAWGHSNASTRRPSCCSAPAFVVTEMFDEVVRS